MHKPKPRTKGRRFTSKGITFRGLNSSQVEKIHDAEACLKSAGYEVHSAKSLVKDKYQVTWSGLDEVIGWADDWRNTLKV